MFTTIGLWRQIGTRLEQYSDSDYSTQLFFIANSRLSERFNWCLQRKRCF